MHFIKSIWKEQRFFIKLLSLTFSLVACSLGILFLFMTLQTKNYVIETRSQQLINIAKQVANYSLVQESLENSKKLRKIARLYNKYRRLF